MNPNHRRERFHDSNLRPDKLQGNNVLLHSSSAVNSLKDEVMPLHESLASSKELSADVSKSAVGSKMTREGNSIPGIPGRDLFLDDAANRGFVGRDLRVDGDGRNQDQCENEQVIQGSLRKRRNYTPNDLSSERSRYFTK